jgi:6-phosphogluconolactonase (cycloisomerase 2 family)
VPITPRRAARWAALAAVAIAALAWSGTAMASHSAGTFYTQTNDPAGNRVQLIQLRGGAPELGRSFPTGGLGTGGGLGNQGAVTVAGRWLLAVNAGSDELSLHRVRPRGLALTDVVPSGGDQPVSVTSDGRRAYTLNAGGDGNVAGFAIGADGRLAPIPGATRPLSAAGAGPAQVELTPDGRTLVVTEKATNTIGTYPVAADGSLGAPTLSPAAGETPFGFAIDRRGRLFVSEAFGGAPDASAVSSYAVSAIGAVAPISPVVRTGQTAACWVALSRDERFAYTTNTGSDTVTGYRIAKDGSLARLGDGVTARTGDGPTDIAFDREGRHVLVLSAAGGTIDAFRAGADGALSPLGSAGGLPAGAVTGLAVR